MSDVATITATDDELRAYLAEAEIPPLLPALAYATGDLSLLRDDLRPDPHLLALPPGRDVGGAADHGTRARTRRADPPPRTRRNRRSPVARRPRAHHGARGGRHRHGRLRAVLEEELALRGDDRRGPQWRKADLAPDTDFRVVVIGAGMSGILTAYRLAQAGVDYTVVEKNADVGGTWSRTRIRAVGSTTRTQHYSYSFAQRHDWPLHYSDQRVLHEYFRDCARDFGVLDQIRFRTEVRSATWDDTTTTGPSSCALPTAPRRRSSPTRS